MLAYFFAADDADANQFVSFQRHVLKELRAFLSRMLGFLSNVVLAKKPPIGRRASRKSPRKTLFCTKA